MRWGHRHAVVLVATLALALGGAGAALAGTPTDQLKGYIDRVIKILDDPEMKSRPRERRAAVRKVANEFFDFGETARRALGRHWQGRTPAEREEFVQLFSELLENSYFSKIDMYGGERIAYAGETVDGEQATARTKIVTKQGSEVPVDYRMLKRGDRWAVYDVVIEGVSLVSNYRTQFNKIIQTSSYQELVRKLKAKHEEFQSSDKRAS